jgi:hypothetical protein
MAVMAVEEGQVEVFWVDDGTRAYSENGPGRFRGAGLVALNPQPNCEGAGALTSGQSHHPTVIQPSSTRRRRGRLGGRFRGINRMGLGADDGRMTVMRRFDPEELWEQIFCPKFCSVEIVKIRRNIFIRRL